MKENSSDMRAENIRRDEAVHAELNDIKRQHAEDLVTLKQEYTSLIVDLRDDYTTEVKNLSETVLMLKGAVVLISIVSAVVSAWTNFGN